MKKKLFKILKCVLILVLLAVLIIGGVIVYFIYSIELSDCAFSPIDQNTRLDVVEHRESKYSLYYSGGGSWQDKIFYLKVYRGDIIFDECGEESIQPVWIREYPHSRQCISAIRLREGKIDAQYSSEGGECKPAKELKFEN